MCARTYVGTCGCTVTCTRTCISWQHHHPSLSPQAHTPQARVPTAVPIPSSACGPAHPSLRPHTHHALIHAHAGEGATQHTLTCHAAAHHIAPHGAPHSTNNARMRACFCAMQLRTHYPLIHAHGRRGRHTAHAQARARTRAPTQHTWPRTHDVVNVVCLRLAPAPTTHEAAHAPASTPPAFHAPVVQLPAN